MKEDDLKRWHKLNNRRFERMLQDYFDTLEQSAIESGFRQYVPEFSADIIKFRELAAKADTPKRRKESSAA
jgi:hypothetical protein